jgi:predicted nucleic acid-binding protein
MAYIEDEPAAERVADMIADAREDRVRLLMSVVNVGEVWYNMARRRSDHDADDAIRDLRSIGIEFIDADWPVTEIAAGYKAKGGISYADCFAAALARSSNATLVTGDREFKRLEKELTIEWLNPQ